METKMLLEVSIILSVLSLLAILSAVVSIKKKTSLLDTKIGNNEKDVLDMKRDIIHFADLLSGSLAESKNLAVIMLKAQESFNSLNDNFLNLVKEVSKMKSCECKEKAVEKKPTAKKPVKKEEKKEVVKKEVKKVASKEVKKATKKEVKKPVAKKVTKKKKK